MFTCYSKISLFPSFQILRGSLEGKGEITYVYILQQNSEAYDKIGMEKYVC